MNTSVNIRYGILALCLLSCAKDPDIRSADKIAVHWRIVTNFTDQQDAFEAEFTITNGSDLTLTNSNWGLFFNMAPRPLISPKNPQPASLHHINGDWYRLQPEKEFLLEPGKSVKIAYRGTEAVIKDTDRPLGLYFVFYDDEQKESGITEVIDFTWSAFATKDQINRTPGDEEPIPTPEWTYKNNLSLKQISVPEASIYPTPVKMQIGIGACTLSSEMSIFHTPDLEKEAAYLGSSLRELTGTPFKTVTSRPERKSITLRLDKIRVAGIASEAYQMEVTPRGITITGSDAAGVFYGIQSLRSLIPLEVFKSPSPSFSIPCVTVEDAPRFAFRGLHLDVSRNFQTKETILKLLDLLSFYKINRFLFYTTEDEGFRVEIKDLPELTEVGAQREHTYGKEAPVLHPAYGSGPFAEQEGKYGNGYYSRVDFIEILKYASDRHIKVIPELNFPAHARAAIKAMEARYERLMKAGKELEANEYRLIDPDDKSQYLSAQGYSDNVVCVARESAFRFYEKVVDEMAQMYTDAGLTMDEFHTGGDEVPEGAWTKSPMALKLMKEHPEIKHIQNLQSYFFRQLNKRLKPKNLKLHGWEEVFMTKTNDGWQPNAEFTNAGAIPYIWNNLFDHPDLGYRLANAGYDVVLCNVSNFYFDLAYSKDPQEPGLYWAGFVDVRNAFTFAPYDMYKTTNKNSMGQRLDLEDPHGGATSNNIVVERLKPEARKHILGVEAQVWSETIKGRDMLEYYTLPKLIGFAESAWTKERVWENIENKNERDAEIQQGWNAFANSLAAEELPRLSYMNKGYNYRVPPPGAIIVNGELKANTEYPGLIIRYTLDGSEPDESSQPYDGLVSVASIVKLKCFDSAGKFSRTIHVDVQ
ncbi:MAG: family 20 glycosylhydrolase [Chryseolinea sp.]